MCEGTHDHDHDDQAAEADAAALELHQQQIEPIWRAAFSAPPRDEYDAGRAVWMYDHYNTGTVVERAAQVFVGEPASYVVEYSDTDGKLSRRTYAVEKIRPASEPRVFTWPSITAAAPSGWSKIES